MCAQSQQLAEVSLGSDVEQGHTRRPEHLATHAQQMQAEGHWIHRKGTTNLKCSSLLGWSMSNGNSGPGHWDASLGCRETQHKYVQDQMSLDSSGP